MTHGLPSHRHPYTLSLLGEALAESLFEAGVAVPDRLAQLRAGAGDGAPPSESRSPLDPFPEVP